MEDSSIRDGIAGALATIAIALTSIATYVRRKAKKDQSPQANGNQVLTDGFRELNQQHKDTLAAERAARLDADQRTRECEKERIELIKQIAELRAEVMILRAEVADLKEEIKARKEGE